MLRYVPILALVVAAGPAFAQTQSPPSPAASSQMPQSSNSLPVGAANMNPNSAANPAVAGSVLGSGAASTAPMSPAPGGPGNAQSTTVPVPASR